MFSVAKKVKVLVLAALLFPAAVFSQTAGNVYVDDFEILLMESFPLQAQVTVKGNLPDPCHTLNEAKPVREGNTFFIHLTAQPSSPDQACIMVLEPFRKSMSLDIYGLPAGTYTVDVNGITKTFELTSDNK